MDLIITVLLTVFIFGLLILIHELGHYIAARSFKVGVKEFAIGFGPKIFQKQGKYNLFSIRAIPMGGFVSMIGETEDVEDESQKSVAFRSKPIWQRMIIALAGSAMNIISGLIVLAVLVISQKYYATNQIGAFNEGAVSNAQGLQVGDTVIKINDAKITNAQDLIFKIQVDGVKPLKLTVLRDGEEKVIENVQFKTITEQGVELAEPDFKVTRAEKTVGRVIKEVYEQSVSNVKMVYSLIGKTITGRFGIEGVSGPIGIGKTIDVVKDNPDPVRNLSFLFVTIALNLGIFNLLPVPMLDGGMIVFLIYEAIFRRRVPEKFETALTMFFMVLLILFAVFIGFKDIFSLFR